ncbi:MAG TPA: septum formation initiator family protein [Thermodesulfovibrionales bacterium]|nr:septum formation initiator family protein [Thermodesulfovibrionales bacterium]
MKRRRLIFYTIVSLSLIYLLTTILFSDMGLLKYRRLVAKKTCLEAQVREIEQDNLQIKSQLRLLKEEPYFKEKYAREEFGLAKPDEYIFQYDR